MAWDEDEAAMEAAADALVAHTHKHPAPAKPVPIKPLVMARDAELRDQFATDFMKGMVATVHTNDDEDLLGYLDPSVEEDYEVKQRVERYDMIAEAAYRMADAMLRARAK